MLTDFNFVRYTALVTKIKELNNLYYNGNSPVSDADYDGLYEEMKALETKLGLKESQLQSQVIGYTKDSFLEEYVHWKPMLSLQTETDSTSKGFSAFDARVRKELMIPVGARIEYISELKYDGLGLNLQYKKGILINILTRGNGEIGENVTHALPMFEHYIRTDISKWYPFDIEIRGEGMISKEDFKELNQSLEAVGQKPLANARNAAAGSIRTLDLEKIKTRKLIFFPYAIGDFKGPGLGKTHGENMTSLFSMGFSMVPLTGMISETTGEPESLAPYNFFVKTETKRDNLNFDIDGVVHKVNSLELQNLLGFRSKEPRWAVAQKFVPLTTETTLISIDVQVGKTGRLTPVAKLMPVSVGGTLVSKATLHNVFDLRKRGIRVGDQITIQRAGDVIPEVAYRKPQSARSIYAPNFHFPKFCPSCNSPVKRAKGEANYYCVGKSVCKEQIIGSLVHFASREAMNIQGLGEATITALVNSGDLKTYLDIYSIDKKTYAVEGNLGEILAEKLMGAIEKSKGNYAWQFLYALSIEEIGRTKSKLLCSKSNLATISDLAALGVKAVPEDLGKSANEKLCLYFQDYNTNHARFNIFLKNYGTKLKYLENKNNEKDLNVVFTGVFKNYSRDHQKSLVEKLGGKVGNSVSSKTTHLVKGDNPTLSKVEKALGLNVKILNDKDFISLINSF